VLRRWVKAAAQEGTDAFRGHGKLTGQAEELQRLRRELDRTRQERDILKKALAFFAKESR
jgi:transposase